jgi:hypothetical protein
MNLPTSLVVASIGSPNEPLQKLADLAQKQSWHFYLIGDKASPENFTLEGCDFYDLERQGAAGFEFAQRCPVRHYARKNIGCLLAFRDGAQVIVETDNDNAPYQEFGNDRNRQVDAPLLCQTGWLNIYRYFSTTPVWPRGLPLDAIYIAPPGLPSVFPADCPIQQGLVDENPDVDAIYRLTSPHPFKFQRGVSIALGNGAWCPFNSRNTTWFRDAFPLMYLPAYCSFRMADIWRSFIAQRIGWEYGWSVLFHEATMVQHRNEHDLMKDFADEIPGYLLNRRIVGCLEPLQLSHSPDDIGHNLRICYEALAAAEIMDRRELLLLDAWLKDLTTIGLIPAANSAASMD